MQTGRQADTYIQPDTNRQIDRQTADGQMDGHTDAQTDTDRHTDNQQLLPHRSSYDVY